LTELSKKIRKSTIFVSFGKIFEQVLNIAITWILIRFLSVNEFGIYNLFLGIATYLAIFSSMGLRPAFSRFLPEFYQKKEFSKFLWTVKTGQILRSILFLFVILVIFIFYEPIGSFLKIRDYREYFLIFVSGYFFLLHARLLQHVLESLFLHQYLVYSNVLYLFLRFLFLISLIFIGFDLKSVLIIDIISSSFFAGILFLFYHRKGVTQLKNTKFSNSFSRKKLFKRIFRYGGFSAFNDIGKNFLDISTDFLLISFFLGSPAVGYYAFSARVGRLVSRWLPSRMLKTVITPAFFAKYTASGDKKDLNIMFTFLSKLNAFFFFPVFTLMIVFGKEIIEYVFDPKYLDSYAVMVVLFLHYILLVFPMALPLQAIEKPELILIAKVASIYNFILAIILLKFWGILGVAIATSSAMLIKKYLEFQMAKRYAEITFPWRGILIILWNCIIIAILAFFLRPYITNIFLLVLISGLIFIFYFMISYFFKNFSEMERQIVNKIIGKNLFRF